MSVYKLALVLLITIKIIFYIVYQYAEPIHFGGNSDADFYHGIATYSIQNEGANIWPYLLRCLNDWGLYTRESIKYLIFAIGLVIFPWVIINILRGSQENQSDTTSIWFAVFTVLLYPTLNYYSLDIYREIPMVTLFLIALLSVKRVQSTLTIHFIDISILFWLFLIIICVSLIYKFRFYLALSLVISFIVAYKFKFEKPLGIPLLFLVLGLTCAYWMGIFNWQMGQYRQTYADAGSAFGVDFSQGLFAINLIKSFFYGVYGIAFQNALSLVVFVLEGLPAIVLSTYICINRKYSDSFVSFLIVFFFVYALAWIVGVDSLGTAVRYRIFNYLALLFAACVIFQNKLIAENKILDKV